MGSTAGDVEDGKDEDVVTKSVFGNAVVDDDIFVGFIAVLVDVCASVALIVVLMSAFVSGAEVVKMGFSVAASVLTDVEVSSSFVLVTSTTLVLVVSSTFVGAGCSVD